MRSLRNPVALVWAILSFSLFHAISASTEPSLDIIKRASSNSSASTWIYEPGGPDGGNFTFTITVDPGSGNMWFRMSAPSQYSWIAVGAGTKMSNSKAMFFAYEGSKDNSITISARGPCDHCEPAYMKSFGLQQQIPPSSDPHSFGVSGGQYFVSAFVANGTERAGINPNSTKQPFIFAVGPQSHAPLSDSPSAPLRMHSLHGNFQLDMTQAQGTNLPLLGTKEIGVASDGTASTDHDFSSPGHAFIMCLAFVVVFPMGILVLRVLNKVKLHMIVQGIGLLLVTIGWILGAVISKQYNRSKSFNSPHQIIGIVVYLLLLVQWAFGVIHHRTYLRTQQPTWMIKPHKYVLGPLVMALGIINNAVGFRFAISGAWNLIYVPIVLAVFIVLAISMTLKRFIAGRKAKQQPFGGPLPPAYAHQPSYGQPVPPSSYGQQQSGQVSTSTTDANWQQRNDIELGKIGPPPSYEPAKPREMI